MHTGEVPSPEFFANKWLIILVVPTHTNPFSVGLQNPGGENEPSHFSCRDRLRIFLSLSVLLPSFSTLPSSVHLAPSHFTRSTGRTRAATSTFSFIS